MKLPKLNLRGWFRSIIKPFFSRNSGLKLFSLACAIGLYVFVHGARDAQRIVAIDLVTLLPPASENRTLTTELPTSVRVTLHGPRSIIGDLRSSDLGNVQLDLRAARSGKVELQPDMLRVPGGVVVDSIEPSSLNITWDDIIKRPIQIQVAVTGSPADGYVLRGRPSCTPNELVARGARQIVESLHTARLEPFDLSGLSEGVHNRTLAIDRPPSRVAFDIANATATVEIVKRETQRLFANIPVQVTGVTRAKLLPEYVDIRVTGNPSYIDELRKDQIVPRVTVSEQVAKTQKGHAVALPVEFSLDNVNVTIIPKTVVVKW